MSNITEIIENQRKYYGTNKTKDIDFRIQKLKQLKKELHFEELKLDGGSDIFECISKTMQACYPERFNFMKGE